MPTEVPVEETPGFIPSFRNRKMTAIVIDAENPTGLKTTISGINEKVTTAKAWEITTALYALTQFTFDSAIETVATNLDVK